MTDPADLRFFRALKDVCAKVDPVDQTCRDAIDSALESGDPQDMQTAHKALESLDDPLRDAVLRRVHLHMATDLSAIWDMMPGAPVGKRPN